MSKTLETQRTYAIVGTGGSGKTSLAEMLLYHAGIVSRLGTVEEGTTLLDYEPEEIKRRGSIQPGFAQFDWNKNPHFCMDTPGDNNFIGDLPLLLMGADAAVFVVDAVDGVRPLTKKLWGEVRKASLPSIVFINKVDRDRADFDMAFEGLGSLGIKPVLLYMPIGAQEDFKGVVDVLGGKAYFFEDGKATEGDIPADMADDVEVLRETTVENIAESDEALMEKYFEEGELSHEEMITALRKGVIAGDLVPVVAGSALKDIAAPQLLDTIDSFFPGPFDEHPRGAWAGVEGERAGREDEPPAAICFKTLSDPFAGQLNVFRVISGTISADHSYHNANRDETERFGQLLLMQGKTQKGVKETFGPGAVFALAKLKNTRTGDTIVADKDDFQIQLPALAPQLITYALAPAEKGEEDKVFAAVHRLLDEDVTLKITRDEETGDTLLSGMGQLHIEISVEKAKRRGKVDIVLKTPKVPYRETIKGRAEVQGRHKKQSGGRGQFGDCWIRVEPMPAGGGYEFHDAIVGGVIPRQYIPAVDKGVQEAAARGYLAGYPVVDFKVTVYDGSYHNVDSSEMAFKVAGSLAFKKAMETCKPVLLEPVVMLTVTIPDEYMGDVIGDLSSRRGKVLGSDSETGITEVRAHVPMSEVLRYAPDLRSMTGGQGTFTMEFDHYEEAPPQVAEKVIENSRKDAA